MGAQNHLYAVGQCGENSTFGAITLPNPEPRWFVARVQLPLLGTPSAGAARSAGFNLAPNPAHEVVQISGDMGAKSVTAVVRDMLGQTVRTAPLTASSATLSLVGLPVGVYLVQIGTQMQRLAVE